MPRICEIMAGGMQTCPKKCFNLEETYSKNIRKTPHRLSQSRRRCRGSAAQVGLPPSQPLRCQTPESPSQPRVRPPHGLGCLHVVSAVPTALMTPPHGRPSWSPGLVPMGAGPLLRGPHPGFRLPGSVGAPHGDFTCLLESVPCRLWDQMGFFLFI